MKNFKSKIFLASVIGISVFASCKKTSSGGDPVIIGDNSESLNSSFFERVNYKGAFGNTDWTSGWANYNPQNTDYPATNATLSGNITTNTTLDASKVYLLSGFVYVKSGVTLTIPAGTILRGDKSSKGTIIVQQGAKIAAEGTASKPIIFTSNLAKGSRSPGDWGGVILLGKAPNNIPGGVGVIEGGVNVTTEGNHGGTDPADNSGIMKYVRIEFPGIAFQPNNEINGLTFGSVGTGTTIDYVEVSFSGDDSYEWFGGTVNCKHLISVSNVDDSFDFDNGFVGKLQFCVGQRDPQLADQAGQSNGIESDNSESAFTTTPRTRPVISNMTIIGPVSSSAALASVDPKHEHANLWRRGSKMILGNSIFIGFKYGLNIRDKETGDALTDGSSLITNNIYQSYVPNLDIIASGSIPSFASVDLLKSYFTSKGNLNINEATSQTLLNSPFSLTAPNFTLKTGSSAATGAKFN
ncbi:hypothetical protein I5M32_06865 [Pedobacter sp. SD-b]|uniref:T9SS C-terminal target domain-containing protein n=1 Tax=Pedobacter segetis TaxID=2793069 RepID=A0ABS1BIJ8_9SPHI|nr:hypothetical protein [Pedobacter segetis]MBK0382680.1 hypothetical protein [Pedobacter segetis]